MGSNCPQEVQKATGCPVAFLLSASQFAIIIKSYTCCGYIFVFFLKSDRLVIMSARLSAVGGSCLLNR